MVARPEGCAVALHDAVRHDLVHIEEGREQVAAEVGRERLGAVEHHPRGRRHAELAERRQQAAGALVLVEVAVQHGVITPLDDSSE